MNYDKLLDKLLAEENRVDEDGGRMKRELVNEQECIRAVIWTALYTRTADQHTLHQVQRALKAKKCLSLKSKCKTSRL